MDQPARSWSEFVGMTARDDAVVLDVEPRHYNADGGVLHGGIIASLMLHAAMTAAPQTRVLDCQINYLKSIKAGRAEARARVRRAGRRFTVIDTKLTGPEVLLANASWVLVTEEIDQAPVRAHQALALPAPAAEASPIGRLLDAFNAAAITHDNSQPLLCFLCLPYIIIISIIIGLFSHYHFCIDNKEINPKLKHTTIDFKKTTKSSNLLLKLPE